MDKIYKDYHIEGVDSKDEASLVARNMAYKDGQKHELRAYKINQIDSTSSEYVFRVYFIEPSLLSTKLYE